MFTMRSLSFPFTSGSDVLTSADNPSHHFGRRYSFSVALGNSASQSARGLAQSKTLRECMAVSSWRQLLDCASPLALSDDDGASLNRYSGGEGARSVGEGACGFDAT